VDSEEGAAVTSPAVEIRDTAHALLEKLVGYKQVRKARVPTYQPDDLPCLSVFILNERGTGDDAFHGEPHFEVRSTIGISAVFSLASPEELEVLLDTASTQIKDTLFRNPKFVRLLQGISGFTRTHSFPQQGETYFAELRFEIDCVFYDSFQPIIEDDFETLHLETRYPHADTDPEAVQQVVAEWDIPQN
jgi:hypothetical protein